MGMFDSIFVKCKECDAEVEFQSKVGDCCLASYSISDAPPEILMDADLTSKSIC